MDLLPASYACRPVTLYVRLLPSETCTTPPQADYVLLLPSRFLTVGSAAPGDRLIWPGG